MLTNAVKLPSCHEHVLITPNHCLKP